jgi:dihydrofolate reductase
MSIHTISAIAAVGQQRELGKDNELIWRIPADLGRLRELTTGHPIIMGRKTYESIGRPLPNRTNIVISRNADFVAPGCIVVTSLEAALAEATDTGTDEVFIFGGAGIYELAWPQITKLYLTVIAATDPDADTFFPDYTTDFVVQTKHEPAEHNGVSYQWVDLVRE